MVKGSGSGFWAYGAGLVIRRYGYSQGFGHMVQGRWFNITDTLRVLSIWCRVGDSTLRILSGFGAYGAGLVIQHYGYSQGFGHMVQGWWFNVTDTLRVLGIWCRVGDSTLRILSGFWVFASKVSGCEIMNLEFTIQGFRGSNVGFGVSIAGFIV